MEWVEITGRTVDEAVEAALDELGVDAADLEHEVLEEPKSGLFGRFGASPARIRARVRPVSREKPGDANRRNRRQGGRSRGGSRSSRSSNDRSRSSSGGANGGREDGGGERSRGGNGGGGRGAAVVASDPAGGTDRDGDDGGERPSGAPRRRRRGGRGRGRSGGAGGAANGTTERSSGANRATGDGSTGEGKKQMETMESDLSVEEQAAIAEQFTAGLVEAFDLGAEVTVVVDDDAILVEIEGASVGLLVGPKGATLSAIEELVRTVVQRQTDGRGARINVDVGGYRAKRREALVAFTQQLAAQVLETQRPKALEPMSAPDRKTVHDAAAEIDGIVTESEGEDSRRHVVLRPA